MPFEDLTLEKLRAATKEQIIAKIVGKLTSMTKKRICEFIWGIRGIETDDLRLSNLIQREDGPNGQIARTKETIDVLGKKMGSQKIEWTYYPTGEVDTITTKDLDALDQMISQKTIKHFTTGKQPVIL